MRSPSGEQPAEPRPRRVNILGVGVSAVNLSQAVYIIESWISNCQQHYVCVTSVHGLIESQRSERLRQIHNDAGLVTPDGKPLEWLLKFYGQNHVNRVYGPDLLLAMCESTAAQGYRHFFYGAEPGTADQLAATLQARFPDLVIVGTYSPPFRPLTEEEDQQVIALLRQARPNIIWVGLGTPKQELWMAEHCDHLDAVLIGVGAAFAIHAGALRQAPRWMQRRGLEWLFRLLVEPQRLWRRYLTIIPRFLFLITYQLLRTGRLPPDL